MRDEDIPTYSIPGEILDPPADANAADAAISKFSREWLQALDDRYQSVGENASSDNSSSTEKPNDRTENFDELMSEAKRLDERSLLGDYGTFTRPFSMQYKRQIRAYSPQDAAVFNETDSKEKLALDLAKSLRLTTLGLFIALSLSLFLPITQNALHVTPNRPWYGFAIFVFMATVLTIARFIVRDKYLGIIKSSATSFGNYFIKELTAIFDRAANAVTQSQKDEMMKSEWPVRSGGWIKIAIYFDKRAENIDRYVTATAWRLESRYRMIEWFFIVLKAILAIFVTVIAIVSVNLPLLFAKNNDGSGVIFGIISTFGYVAVVLKFWGLWVQKNNAVWSIKFRESVKGFDERRDHIYGQIADIIAMDKKFLMSTTRGGGSSSPSRSD